jgi:hypothetical protein
MPNPRSKSAGNSSPETKLDQFSSCFKTEADLRLALIALLEKLPNTRGVRHTHGTGEKGKDIVFVSGGPFASEDLIACVVKNSPITGSADSDDGARTVFHQAEQSLDTPILNSKGEEEFVSRAFIITPYECGQSAIESIKGKLKKPDGVVKFLYGRELYELFENYYPDYLVFRSGLFGTYIADLESGISNDSAVANLLMKHGLSGQNHDISKIYVQPSIEIAVCQLFLVAEWPDLATAPNRMLEQDVVSFGQRSIALGQLLGLIAGKEEAGTIDGQMRWLASSLQSLWKHAYKNYQGDQASIYRSEAAERRRVALALPEISNLNQEFQEKAKHAKQVFDEFRVQLEHANELAASKPARFRDVLSQAARFDYSYVRGIAAQMPSLMEEAVLAATTIKTTSRELMDSEDDALITAPAGFGKTSFCRWNVLNDLKALKEGQSTIVPVLIPLHQLTVGPGSTAVGVFFSAKGLQEMWSKRRSADGATIVRKFRLYLDGLDEIPDVNKQRLLLGLAREIKKLEPATQIIVTGREHVAGSHLNRLSRFHVAEMNDGQMNELFDQWFSTSTERRVTFKRQLESVPSLKQIMRVPLLATLVLSVYESTSTLPESRVRLYDMFIGLMAGGWDVAKKVHRDTQFGPQPKTTVLQYLAGRMQINESREASTFQFNAAVRTLLPALESRAAALLEEIVHDGLLVRIGNGYIFSHLSFQEYLAAKDLMEPKGTKAAEALARYLKGDQWWKEVLSFYVALSGQPKDIELFIRAEAVKAVRKTPDQQVLQRTIGLLKEIAEAYPGARPDLEFPQWPKIRNPASSI